MTPVCLPEQGNPLNARVFDSFKPLEDVKHLVEESQGPLKEVDSPEILEQALESHEVIELQTFSEKKAWIEEKIQFLEKMPSVQVFAGLEALRASAEIVPGLPTRDELQHWITEHDVIEKETEVLDSGELKKLRQLTKAATQRNLSPQDTDVIELTLTTIYALDKLLHLLRDRSENLELLGIRLTWEEHRKSAWADRCKIIDDLRAFLTTRARWNSAMYENTNHPEEGNDTTRRGSVASLASGVSDTSLSTSSFSRSARFKLAELLSRDAASFAGRVSSLRHGSITAAGKALDKLIENSRNPVPDILLDEQDRLEEKGINELENIGKFALSLVMQWRKADEIYVETLKDQKAARSLMEEIEVAKLLHPTSKQSSSFISRADILTKRLSVRGNPASTTSSFIKPENVLFDDQIKCNEDLIQSLAFEVATAGELVQSANAAAKEYRASFDVARRLEVLLQATNELSQTFSTLIEQVQRGVKGGSESGDGIPPDLTCVSCLEPTSHSLYLALFPSLLKQAENATDQADTILRDSKVVLFELNLPCVSEDFKARAVAEFKVLAALRDETRMITRVISERAVRLREARSIWTVMQGILAAMEGLRMNIVEAMDKDRWRQETGGKDAPLTPESHSSPSLVPVDHPSGFNHKLDQFQDQIHQEVDVRVDSLCKTLETPLKELLLHNAQDLQKSLELVKGLHQLLGLVRKQSTFMTSIREQFHMLQLHLEGLKTRMRSITSDTVSRKGDADTNDDPSLLDDANCVEAKVNAFVDDLSGLVPFISRHSNMLTSSNISRRQSSIGDGNFAPTKMTISHHISVDLTGLDAAVRADSNHYAMRLHGELENVGRMRRHLEVARMCVKLDDALSVPEQDITESSKMLKQWKDFLCTTVSSSDACTLPDLEQLIDKIEEYYSGRRTKISRSLSHARESLRQIHSMSAPLDASVRDALYEPRFEAVSDAELRYKQWDEGVMALKESIHQAHHFEHNRLAHEQREREVEARRVVEEAERLRLEREVHREIEKRKDYETQIAEEARLELIIEKEKTAKKAEKTRLLREEAEANIRKRAEEALLAEALRSEKEKDRGIQEELQRKKLQREKEEVQEKLRLAEERLVFERKLQTEREIKVQVVIEELAQQQLAAEQQKVAERLEEAQRANLQLEAERAAANARLEMEVVARKKLEEEAEARTRFAADEAVRQVRYKLPHGRSTQSNTTLQLNPDIDSADPDGSELLSPMFISNHADASDDEFFGALMPPFSIRNRSTLDFRSQILALRKRLWSINVNDILRLSKSSQHPRDDLIARSRREFDAISHEVNLLPATVEDYSINAELLSLRTEIGASSGLLKQIEKLAEMSSAVQICDAALSDLLEHIDSYPSAPITLMSISYKRSTSETPEQELSGRLQFTNNTIVNMNSKFSYVQNDQRASDERARILRTWSELEEMATDCLSGKKSQASSTISAKGRAGIGVRPVMLNFPSSYKKAGSYSSLSVSAASRTRLLAPPASGSSARRAVSGSNESQFSKCATDRMTSASTNRSVSGPLSASIYGSTYTSRQRTASLSNTNATPLRARMQMELPQARSPNEILSQSRSTVTPSRSSTKSMSTWSRAPRNSLSSIISRASSPQKKDLMKPRRKYIADPKSKLDMAVGEVVNQLPVGINVEGVAETWKDQSGKYWIGNQDAKLCFCRILRSHTVMVRVGGGWTELSKFIKDHFADSFRLLSESGSPPRVGIQEEKWIHMNYSSTRRDAAELESSKNPRTPEPIFPFVPSFSLMTPSGRSPQTKILTPSSSKGSPMTPLQFIRRAEQDPTTLLRPVTPSKPPTRGRNLANTPHSLNRNSIWRP